MVDMAMVTMQVRTYGDVIGSGRLGSCACRCGRQFMSTHERVLVLRDPATGQQLIFDRACARRAREVLQRVTSSGTTTSPCPDCGSTGPHHVQRYMGDREFACAACGMQHLAPEVTS